MKLKLEIDNDCDVAGQKRVVEVPLHDRPLPREPRVGRYDLNSNFDDSAFFNPQRREYAMDFLGIGGSGSDLAQIQVNNEVSKQFPYPQNTCAEIQTSIDGLTAARDGVLTNKASNATSAGSKRVLGRYEIAYNDLITKFTALQAKFNCKALLDAQSVKDAQTQNDLAQQQALADSAGVLSASNKTILYAVGGIMLVSVMLIVLKKKSN